MERARSLISGDIERRPTAASITIGKNEIRNATRTFGMAPTPNQTRNNGAIATLGTTWKNSIVGMTNSSKRLDDVIATASGMAIPTAKRISQQHLVGRDPAVLQQPGEFIDECLGDLGRRRQQIGRHLVDHHADLPDRQKDAERRQQA